MIRFEETQTHCDSVTILLAEDNAADIMLVREALRQHQIACALTVIKDGAEMIALLDSLDNYPKLHDFDLVLLDMHLPKHDGDQILKKLRSTEHYALTPVIIMTASLSPQDRAKTDKLAALHYCNKPANLTDFMKLGVLIGEILQKKKQDDRMEGGELRPEALA